jgi:hypothetical protein
MAMRRAAEYDPKSRERANAPQAPFAKQHWLKAWNILASSSAARCCPLLPAAARCCPWRTEDSGQGHPCIADSRSIIRVEKVQ